MLYEFVKIALDVLFLGFLVVGLILCRIQSFKAGFYFFLILILHKIASFFYSRLMLNNIEIFRTPPLGLTPGEFVELLFIILRMIELIAFGILTIGLLTIRKQKSVSQN